MDYSGGKRLGTTTTVEDPRGSANSLSPLARPRHVFRIATIRARQVRNGTGSPLMSDKILKHLRSAQALSQSGRCVESARVIISALNALRCSSEASSFQPQQARHLMDSLAPLLKYVYYAFTPSYFMLPTLFTATPSKQQWTRSTCPFPTCCSCTYRLFHVTRTIPMYVAVLMLCFMTLERGEISSVPLRCCMQRLDFKKWPVCSTTALQMQRLHYRASLRCLA
jgi:hypothetical protein